MLSRGAPLRTEGRCTDARMEGHSRDASSAPTPVLDSAQTRGNTAALLSSVVVVPPSATAAVAAIRHASGEV